MNEQGDRERIVESSSAEDRALAELIRLIQADGPTVRAIDNVAGRASGEAARRRTVSGLQRAAVGAFVTCGAVLVVLLAMHPAARERIEPDLFTEVQQAPMADTAGVTVPATPAGAQFARWLSAFNAATREALVAYHEQHFPYVVASEDVGSLDREHRLSLGTGGFTVKHVERSDATNLTILLQERLRPQFARVQLEVETREPHRVVRFEIHPLATPPQFLSQQERAQRSVDARRRESVVDVLCRELEAHYVFLDVAQQMVATVREKASHDGYDTLTDATELAKVLTEDLRQVSGDKHLTVRFGQPPPPLPAPAPLSEAPPAWIVAENYGFGPPARIGAHVALLTINGFVPLLGESVEQAIGARMSEIADAEAVIIDLRANGGGDPETVAFVASYFFEGRARLLSRIYRRDTDETREFWTKAKLPGARFGATKPVYVLTSGRTFSGGEDLAYTLQAHHRAIVIGEVTGGGAHPTEPRAIDDGLFVMIPSGRSINPITNSNWEGRGVQPDVPSSADQALRRALEALAEHKPRWR